MNNKRYIAASVALGCTICGAPNPHFHHPRRSKAGAAMGKKAKDKNGYPLCFYHHVGDGGIHTLGRKSFEAIHGTELSLWNRNRARLGMEQLEGWL